MVLVWNVSAVAARDPSFAPPHDANTWRSFQPYAIIDPADIPTTGDATDPPVRYRNRLLPIGVPIGINPVLGILLPSDVFCSGHTWSNFGDLIVVGGTQFMPSFIGATLTYARNPHAAVQNYPGTIVPMYSGAGLWVAGSPLDQPRWYPTAVLTHPLSRTNPTGPAREVVFVLGGSSVDPALAGCTPNGATQPSWNSIEGLVINARADAGNQGIELRGRRSRHAKWLARYRLDGGVPPLPLAVDRRLVHVRLCAALGARRSEHCPDHQCLVD
jgi:hypothetical protein